MASFISVIMPWDFKVVRIKQVFHSNSVLINEVPLYIASSNRTDESVHSCNRNYLGERIRIIGILPVVSLFNLQN